MSGIKGFKDWLFASDIDESFEDEGMEHRVYEETPITKTNEFETVASKKTSSAMDELAKKKSQMVLFEPRSYSESQGIADHLKTGRACVINLHKLPKEQAKRIIDFLSGVVYAITGDIQKVGPHIFLCTPSNFGVYGEISDDDQNW